MNIDTAFDFRTDTPPGRDPDSHSPTLRRYHQLLWSKPLLLHSSVASPSRLSARSRRRVQGSTPPR